MEITHLSSRVSQIKLIHISPYTSISMSKLLCKTDLKCVDEVRDLEAHQPRVGRGLRVQRQAASGPVHDHHVEVTGLHQLILNLADLRNYL